MKEDLKRKRKIYQALNKNTTLTELGGCLAEIDFFLFYFYSFIFF